MLGPGQAQGVAQVPSVRTINRIHADAPLDLVLLGGDNADNAQENELTMAIQTLDGSRTALIPALSAG